MLIVGIAVAVVITLTTIVYHDQQAAARKLETPAKTSINRTAIEVIKKLADRVELRPIK